MGRAGDDFHSPDMQVEAMRRAIGAAGLHEIAVVEDLDRSGQNFSREGIDQIRALVEAGQVDVVAVFDLSRLGRDLADSLAFIRWLRERNVSVMSAQERIDDTPEGQYLLGMFLGLAELYGAQVGRRWAQIIERRSRLGKHHGIPPTGYVRDGKSLRIDPVVGPAVAEAFRAYVRGDLVQNIMVRFAAARGRPVQRTTIRKILANPAYVGRVRVNSRLSGSAEFPGEHEPLIDDDTWKKAQARLARDSKIPPRSATPAHSLTGIVFCAHCKGGTQVIRSNQKPPQLRLYCRRKVNRSDGCEGFASPLYDDIEVEIIKAVIEYASRLRSDPLARAAQLARSQRAGVDAKALEGELAATRSAMARITQRWGRGQMPDAAYEGAIADLAATERMLTEQLAEASEVATAPAPHQVVGLIEEMLVMWPELTEATRNRGLRTVLRRVYIRRALWRGEPIADRIVDFDWVY
jgi:DNA invertase Pin-like site-specific DNA recombinase